MNDEQLEAQSREAIIACLNDSSVEIEFMDRGGYKWHACIHLNSFDLSEFHYRIAKPKKWYRVAKLTFDNTTTADNEEQEKRIESSARFTEWLDERKYYD